MITVTDPWKEISEEEPGYSEACLGLDSSGSPYFFTRMEDWGEEGYVKITRNKSIVTMRAMSKKPLLWVKMSEIGMCLRSPSRVEAQVRTSKAEKSNQS